MSALSITATSVIPASGATFVYGFLSANATAGQTAYLHSDGTYRPADADASQAAATVAGVFVTGGNSGQYCVVQTGGNIIIGATVAVGKTYCAGPNAGEIVPDADIANPSYRSVIGVGISSTQIRLAIVNSYVQVP